MRTIGDGPRWPQLGTACLEASAGQCMVVARGRVGVCAIAHGCCRRMAGWRAKCMERGAALASPVGGFVLAAHKLDAVGVTQGEAPGLAAFPLSCRAAAWARTGRCVAEDQQECANSCQDEGADLPQGQPAGQHGASQHVEGRVCNGPRAVRQGGMASPARPRAPARRNPSTIVRITVGCLL
jgi:hypothetical protein